MFKKNTSFCLFEKSNYDKFRSWKNIKYKYRSTDFD